MSSKNSSPKTVRRVDRHATELSGGELQQWCEDFMQGADTATLLGLERARAKFVEPVYRLRMAIKRRGVGEEI